MRKNKIISYALDALLEDVRDWPDEFEFTFEEVKELANEYEEKIKQKEDE